MCVCLTVRQGPCCEAICPLLMTPPPPHPTSSNSQCHPSSPGTQLGHLSSWTCSLPDNWQMLWRAAVWLFPAAPACVCRCAGQTQCCLPSRKRHAIPGPCASLFPSLLSESQPPATSLQKSESCLGSREMGPAACETTDMRYEEWEMREQTDTRSLVQTHAHTHTYTHFYRLIRTILG